MPRFVALLRGINVGGNNLIRMAQLKTCFEERGFRNVATYIQSGNVVFEAPAPDATILAQKIEKMLCASFEYDASVVLLTHENLRRIVRSAPDGFGARPDRYRYDVLFLKAPLIARDAIKQVPIKDGVDQVHAGPGVLYFSRLISRASQSRLSRIVATPIYRNITIRNWNTTTRLLDMLERVA